MSYQASDDHLSGSHKISTCLPMKANTIAKRLHTITNVYTLWLIYVSLLVTCIESLQIPDQQIVVGKLFHHRIQLTSSHDVKSIHVGEAGDGLTLP
ncbi:unnamed protein product, partial [Medioppia subpectinata]